MKLENIVVNKDGHIKLVDFGFAKVLSDENKRTYTSWGTKGYIAPEIINNYGHEFKCDVYSFGVLFWYMVTGIIPDDENKLQKIYNIAPRSKDFKDLISKWLDSLPENRPTIKEIMMHKMFKDIDWDEINGKKHHPFFIPDLPQKYDDIKR